MAILIRGARVLTLEAGPIPRRGLNLGLLAATGDTDVLIDGPRIVAVVPGALRDDPRSPTFVPKGGDEDLVIFEADGRVLMPGFVDCHTHACFAGDRLDEWGRACAGASYLEILESGGGIMATVHAVRTTTQRKLRRGLRERLERMARGGTTTVEVKSGYGLETKHELKMLRAIHDTARDVPGTVVATALLGHALDPEQPDFVRTTIEETLPAVHEEFPGITIDAYCEQGAWSVDDCRRLFERARELGHPVRVHADQFHALGMTPLAIELGARSVDHLEATPPDQLAQLAESPTFGVALPCSGFHVDDRYAKARAFVDAGGALAIATNFNPGSAPCASMPLAIALSVRKLGLTPSEAIAAATVNAAALLGFQDRGVIAPGARADLALLQHTDERALAHQFGGDPVDLALCGGEVV